MAGGRFSATLFGSAAGPSTTERRIKLLDAPRDEVKEQFFNIVLSGTVEELQAFLEEQRLKDQLKTVISFVDNECFQHTALHFAAMQGDARKVEILIGQGAVVDVRDSLARTPMHCAAYNGYQAIVEALMQGGARLDAVDSFERTPKECAEVGGHAENEELMAMLTPEPLPTP